MTYSELQATIETTPVKHVPKSLQQRYYFNFSTNPKGHHISVFIHKNKVIMAREHVKIPQTLLDSWKVPLNWIQNRA